MQRPDVYLLWNASFGAVGNVYKSVTHLVCAVSTVREKIVQTKSRDRPNTMVVRRKSCEPFVVFIKHL